MRMPTNKKSPDFAAIRQSLLAKTRLLAGMAPGTFTKLRATVKPATGKSVGIDLLENRFVARVNLMPTGRSNDLDSSKLFEGMVRAYQENRDDLTKLSEYEQLLS